MVGQSNRAQKGYYRRPIWKSIGRCIGNSYETGERFAFSWEKAFIMQRSARLMENSKLFISTGIITPSLQYHGLLQEERVYSHANDNFRRGYRDPLWTINLVACKGSHSTLSWRIQAAFMKRGSHMESLWICPCGAFLKRIYWQPMKTPERVP